MPGCAGSRATATTTRRSTSAAATSTSATTTTGDYWSPSWQPTRTELEDYRCRHGLGYTVIGSRRAGIEAETLYFVPLGETLEIWRTRITNRRDDAREALAVQRRRVLPLGRLGRRDELPAQPLHRRGRGRGRRDLPQDRVPRTARPLRLLRLLRAALAGFDTQREAFLGPYRGWDRPAAVEQGRSRELGRPRMGADRLAPRRARARPGRTPRDRFVLGYAENPPDAKFDPPGSGTWTSGGSARCIEPLPRAGTAVDAAFAPAPRPVVGSARLVRVVTPSDHVDRMVNVWNPYQCMATFNLSRSASSSSPGIGRGMGFRDSNQDLLGFVHMVPERARERILDLAATQLPDGRRYHQYQPLTKRGNDAIGSGFNDDPLWLILAVAAYVKETGDLAILDEPVPFDNEPGTEAPLLDHLAALAPVHAGAPRAARSAADRPRRLERLPEPQLLLESRASRSRRPRTARVASPSRCSSPASSSWPPRELAELEEHVGDPARPRRSGDGGRGMARAVARARLGRRVVPPRVRPRRPAGRLRRRTTRGAIFIEPQGMCVMAGIGLDDGTRARARSTSVGRAPRHAARHRAAAARRTRATASSSARSPRTRPATRRTPASSATRTRGS